MPDAQADLLRLLELAHPGRPQADLLAMIEATPDRPGAKGSQKPQEGHSTRRGIYPPRKPQRPPVRAVAIERRRRLAYSGPLPPQLAAQFTLGELSCLRIIADEVRERGFCALTLGAIAARAGCCRELAKRAVRKANREELMTVEERRRPGQVNLPNMIRIISREWLAWIARGPRPRDIGETKSAPTDTSLGLRSKRETERLARTQNWGGHHGQGPEARAAPRNYPGHRYGRSGNPA